MARKMKSIIYTRYGGPEVLHLTEAKKPIPKNNEVLIRVHATTVTAADMRMRKADPFLVRLFNGLARPRRVRTLGLELAGVIEEVGASVEGFKEGDEVFATPGFRFGAYAEYITMPATGVLALKPANLTFEEAASVPVGGITALFYLKEKGKIRGGQKVLIYGASGSVGTHAVQIAKHFSAYVTAVCGATNVELVRYLKADNVLDYSKEDFRQHTQQYDIIFDAVGKLAPSVYKKMLAKKGRFVSVKKGDALRSSLNLNFLKELIDAGELRPVIDRIYSFEQIIDAHKYADSGHKKGSVVITLNGCNFFHSQRDT